MNNINGRTSKHIEKKEIQRKLSESNRVGFLKKSKKYAQGKEYNTLEGRIKIINRYLEDGEIMISFLNMKTDKIVIMSELDVNSMLYRYTTEIAKKAQGDVLTPSKYNYSSEEIHALRSESEALERALEEKQKIIDQQFELIKTLMEQIKRG